MHYDWVVEKWCIGPGRASWLQLVADAAAHCVPGGSGEYPQADQMQLAQVSILRYKS